MELQKRNIPTWFDEAEILPGDSLIEKIEQGLRKMDYLGVFLSLDSIKSHWVKKEVNIALTQEIKGRRVRVIPILINELDDKDIPPMLADKYYIDFRDRHPFQKGIHELLMLLDENYADSINKLIGILEMPNEGANAFEGVLSAAGYEVEGIAELYKYYEIYKQMGIELEKVYQMYKVKPEGSVERLAEHLKKDLPYPLWNYLASPEMLRKILKGFGENV